MADARSIRMILYNLFPTLVGPFPRFGPHLERAASMGFDWVFVNPVHQPGASKSLYSVSEYRAFNPLLVDPRSTASAEEQLRAVIARADRLGMKMMVDLVINHTAYDSPLTREHPEWYRQTGGKIAHPSAMQDGREVVWRDLAELDWTHTPDREGLYAYFEELVFWLMDLGFEGFRCDAAYQVPQDVWRRLIGAARRKNSSVVFAAETLGNPPDQTRETAQAGFDYVFNSGCWWNFEKPWLLAQYELTRSICPSIGFPESHDTERLAETSNGNERALMQRYLFAALFSGGVLMPIGYEYGFRRRLHVVKTRPDDWETPTLDLTEFIRETNTIKKKYPIFLEDAPTHRLDVHGNHRVLVLWKGSTVSRREALIVLNKDTNLDNTFRVESLRELVQSGRPLECVSPENPLDYVPQPFEYELAPGEGLVFVTER